MYNPNITYRGVHSSQTKWYKDVREFFLKRYSIGQIENSLANITANYTIDVEWDYDNVRLKIVSINNTPSTDYVLKGYLWTFAKRFGWKFSEYTNDTFDGYIKVKFKTSK